jgi:hypothetical protein
VASERSTVAPWTDPAWLAEARAWIRAHVEPTGPIEQPHVRPWSTVLRVPTAAGDVWFKANVPVHACEAAVVSTLARLRPDRVPALVAVDLDRGWMLMHDAGVRLRELIERERDLARWLDVLPAYGELQLAAVDDAEDLIALGVPDRRLALLPGQAGELLDDIGHVAEMCDELAAYGIPETIQHDDFHDAQVFAGPDSYVVFDWGDACVSHPFFSMSVTLEGVIGWGLDDVAGSVDLAPFRDAYLDAFGRYGSRDQLEAALSVALRLGWLCRALNVHRFALAYESPTREEHLQGVDLRLRLFAEDPHRLR